VSDDATVTVVGSGVAIVQPDVLSAMLGVEVRDASPSAAMNAAAGALASVRSAVLSAGAGERDLQTIGVSVRPDWDHDGRRPQLVGYLAQIGLRVKLREVAGIARLLDAAVSAGGDAARLHGLRWEISDTATPERSARAAAFADARSRVEHYAAMAERAVGAVVRIDETRGWDGEAPMPRRYFAASASMGEMEADPGEAEVRSSVTVTWELD